MSEDSVATLVYATVPPVPNATELESVPVSVNVLDAVNVLPAAKVSTPVPAVKVFPLYVLLVKASDPANVASVPVVGRVTLVAAVEVRVMELVADVANVEFAPSVIVPDPEVMVFPL